MNPQEPRADAGLQGDGTKGGTKNGGDVVAQPGAGADQAAVDGGTTGALVTQLGELLRRLIDDAGSPALPLRVRLDLATLLAHVVPPPEEA